MSVEGRLPYGRQHIDEDDIQAVAAVLRSEWLTTGPAVTAFEAALAEIAGGHDVVAVNSGTAALHAAYAAIGLGPGDEIITTPLTFAATATAARHLGATVRFADVDEDTLTLDPARAVELVSERTRAVVAVDYAGQPADLSGLRTICERHGLVLIEDAAHAIGARYRDRPVGDIADLTIFSFHPVKTITTGEGGAVVVRGGQFLESIRRFRSHGLVRDPAEQRHPREGPWHQEIHELGLNYRMPDILAALGTSQLAKLGLFVRTRAELVSRYRSLLANVADVRTLGVRTDSEPAWHLFPIRVPGSRRRAVFDRLRSAGIAVQVHYLPVYRHPVFEDLGYPRGLCPIAERAYEQLISLPLYPTLTHQQQDRVVEVVVDACG